MPTGADETDYIFAFFDFLALCFLPHQLVKVERLR